MRLSLRTKQIFFILFTAILLGTSTGAWSAEKPRYVGLTILYTNDIHGHLFPLTYENPTMPGVDVGGAARRAALIREIKSASKNKVLVMDAGDLFTRGPISDMKGVPDFSVANAIPCDVMTIGNNEFKGAPGLEGQKILMDRIKQARFPIVCANAMYQSDGKYITQPYIIQDCDGIKVAIFGVTAPRVAEYSQSKGLVIQDPITVAAKLVPELRQKADFIIALTHIGYDLDQKLAAEVPGIDVIIGGDSHTWLPKPVLIPDKNRENSAFEIPGVLVCQDGEWGRSVGELILRLRWNHDHFYKVMGYSGKLVSVDSSIHPAGDITKILDQATKSLSKTRGKLEKPIARSDAAFWVAQSMKNVLKTQIAAIGMDDVENGLPSGNITDLSIRRMIPYPDKVVTYMITGKDLDNLLQETPRATAGTEIREGIKDERADENRFYSLATTDYLASGSKTLSKLQPKDSSLTLQEVVAKYLQSQSTKGNKQ